MVLFPPTFSRKPSMWPTPSFCSPRDPLAFRVTKCDVKPSLGSAGPQQVGVAVAWKRWNLQYYRKMRFGVGRPGCAKEPDEHQGWLESSDHSYVVTAWKQFSGGCGNRRVILHMMQWKGSSRACCSGVFLPIKSLGVHSTPYSRKYTKKGQICWIFIGLLMGFLITAQSPSG